MEDLDSFRRIFEDVIKNNYNTVLVLEDDCQFTDDFKKNFLILIITYQKIGI